LKYYVNVAGASHEVVVDGETVTVDGAVVRAHLEELAGGSVQLLRLGSEVHRLVARPGGRRGEYDIAVGGYRFKVEAVDERSRTIQQLSGATRRLATPPHLAAPMPGLIVRVNVNEGDPVRAGQGLMVMEAMKMENELRAAHDATVRRILVKPGSAVEKGAILLELE